jgi:hypothetical protein
MDLEIGGKKKEGSDLIKEFNLTKNAILVTSHFGDKDLMNDCTSHGIKIIPKTMANNIEILSPKALDLVVHLEDDFLIQMAWKNTAEKNGLNYRGFSNCQDLKENINEFSKEVQFYIDLDIGGNQENSISLIKELNSLGYTHIYAASGFEEFTLPKELKIKSNVGKRPPWN